MDPAPQPQSTPPATQPVMDIKPPRVVANEPVKAPPPEAGNGLPDGVDVKKQAPKPVKPPKPPRPHGSGVALAIVATLIIVLGLGALFVYAYLQTTP